MRHTHIYVITAEAIELEAEQIRVFLAEHGCLGLLDVTDVAAEQIYRGHIDQIASTCGAVVKELKVRRVSGGVEVELELDSEDGVVMAGLVTS